MAGIKVAIRPLEDDLLKRVGQKWPRRLLFQSLFASPALMAKMRTEFGQFVRVKDAKGRLFYFRAFVSSRLQQSNCIHVHRDVLGAIVSKSDLSTAELLVTPVMLNHIDSCNRLQLATEDSEITIDDDFKSSVKMGTKDCLVAAGSRLVIHHYGKPIVLKIDQVEDLTDLMSSMALGDQQTSTPQRQPDKIAVPKIVTDATSVTINSNRGNTITKEALARNVNVGGLATEESAIMNAISVLSKPKSNYVGILLYGPSGTGKTLLAKSIASKRKHFQLSTINGSDVFSRYSGETEQTLKTSFAQASQSSHAIIFIDEFDTLASNIGNSDQERRVSACLKVLMDDLASAEDDDHKVVLIAASGRPDAIDPSFRRPGRLDLEIELCVPNPGQRADIIKTILDKSHSTESLTVEDIRLVAQNAHGYVGADLEAVIAQAVLSGSFDRQSCIDALKIVKPSAMREVQVNVPNVTWEDIGGLEDLKLQLRQAVEWPIKYPEAFQRMGVTPPKGVLMYGPPGCSKTMIAKALANESQLNFVAIKGPELFKKWVGESEQVVLCHTE
jgi:SpoVK/Ycf46/Vps4 family AAA+-type ATPase